MRGYSKAHSPRASTLSGAALVNLRRRCGRRGTRSRISFLRILRGPICYFRFWKDRGSNAVRLWCWVFLGMFDFFLFGVGVGIAAGWLIGFVVWNFRGFFGLVLNLYDLYVNWIFLCKFCFGDNEISYDSFVFFYLEMWEVTGRFLKEPF